MAERFAPTVHMVGYHGGYTVTPRGWQWVLGFALAGCQWALDEANTEEFRAIIRADLTAQDDERRTRRIAELEAELSKLRRGAEDV